MRSKSQQQAGSESSQEGCDPSTPIADFNDLHIASGVKLDLRHLAYERFMYDFVIFETPNRAPEIPSDALWDFIPYLYERSLHGSCLATVVNAVAYANFANRCNAPQAQVLAEECHKKGMKLLQMMISSKDSASSDEALCAVYLMGIYDVWLSSLLRKPPNSGLESIRTGTK